MDDNYKYYAFISYNREDEEWAMWLQYELEHYNLPDNLKNREELPKEFRPVFRDIDELKAGDLHGQIYDALKSSMYLIVICSPRSVNSKWVNKEITDFIEIGNEKGINNYKRVFPFIVEGAPDAQDDAQKCFPKALCDLLEKSNIEILRVNVNENGRDRAFVKVLAGMLPDSISFDMLWNRYDRDKMEREHKEKEKKDKLLIAQSRFVAEKAQKLIDEGDTDTAIKLALEVLPQDLSNPNRPYCVEAETALRKAVWFDKIQRVFKGHDDQVIFASFSPNDDKIVSFSLDETLRVWDVKDGRMLYTIPIISKRKYTEINSFEFNNEGSLALMLTNDGVLRLINIEKRNIIVLYNHVGYACFVNESNKVFLSTHNSRIMLLDLDVPENVICVESPFKSVRLIKRLGKALLYRNNGFFLLDLETKEINQIIDDYGTVESFSISYDECVIQCLQSNKKLSNDSPFTYPDRINDTYCSWNLQGTMLVGYKVLEPDEIVQFSPDRKHLLLSSKRVLNCETGEEVIVFEKFKDSAIIKSVFSIDGHFLALSTYKGMLVWNSKENSCMFLDDSIGEINDFSFSNNGEVLLCSAVDGKIKMIAINTKHHSQFGEEKDREISLYRHVNSVNRIRFISNGQKLVSSSLCSIIVWDIKNEKRIGIYPNTGDSGHTISLDKKEESLITTWRKDGPKEPWRVLTINILTGKWERYFDVKEGTRYYHPSYSPDGNFVASIFRADEKPLDLRYGVVLWDIYTKKKYYYFRHEAMEYDINGYEFSNDGSMLVTCTKSSIVLWDIKKKQKVLTIKDSISKETPLLFYYDEECKIGSIVYITDYHRIKIFDIANNRSIELKGHTQNVISMALDPQGIILATVSLDKTIRTWSVQTGEKLNTFYGHDACVNYIVFNQDGSLLASASDDGTIGVWDVSSGTNIELIKAHYGAVTTVCFSPDGSMLASGGFHDFAVRVWEYPPLQELIDKYRNRYKNCPLTLNEKTKYYLE
jgi:WD40 repeat protein